MSQRHQPRYSKGQRIANRFLVHQALMGGMGEVYLCLDERDFVPVALKTFQGTSPNLYNIFKGEVASWIALEKHPNIVRCFYMEKFDNAPFMVLEWVAGEEGKGTDLRSWLRHGPLDLPLALRFTIDIVRGLIHANEKVPGIVHRDLKPDNVLVNQSRQAKITDFGLATIAQMAKLDPDGLDQTDMGQSRYVGNVVGTPAYMPPEQWRGDSDIDFRADIYAVGCILYELLTGKWLYDGYTFSELRAQHLESPLPSLNNNLPTELKPILEGCLAKQREDRFARLDLLLAELVKLYEAHSDEPLPEVSGEAFTAGDYVNRGATFANLGQHERAIDDYDHAITLKPNFALSYLNRSVSYGKLGHRKRAIEDCNRAIALDPDFAPAYSNRGYSYAELGHHEQAIEDYNHAIALDPDFAPAYSNRGYSYGELGYHSRAIQDYDTLIRLEPHNAVAYVDRGETRFSLGHLELAIRDFDAAINLDPNDAQAYSDRGLSYAEMGLHKRAIQDYDVATHLDPNYATAYYNRGRSYGEIGLYEQAIRDYDVAISLNPNDAQSYFNKGIVLTNATRLQESLPLFEKAYALGVQQAVGVIQQVRERLGLPPIQMQADPNDPQAAFDTFQQAGALDGMRQTVQQFPILKQMIPTIEQVIQQQVPPQQRPAFEQKLAWLRQIVGGE